ncbi:MAG: metalloregulator ArsR/SmtB family transcription factor [Clostridia bacterium]|nr:metalloregulator ArsR/SmtB family transcription factor [Clostridia bacterium]
MSYQLHQTQSDFFKALAHPTRLQIMELLRSGERCVCEIFPALEMEQSSVSRHLAILKREGLLHSRKDGLKVIYWAADLRVYQVIDRCSDIIRRIWQDKAEAVG